MALDNNDLQAISDLIDNKKLASQNDVKSVIEASESRLSKIIVNGFNHQSQAIHSLNELYASKDEIEQLRDKFEDLQSEFEDFKKRFVTA